MCSKSVEDRLLSSFTYAEVPASGKSIPSSHGRAPTDHAGGHATTPPGASAAIEALAARLNLSALDTTQPGTFSHEKALSDDYSKKGIGAHVSPRFGEQLSASAGRGLLAQESSDGLAEIEGKAADEEAQGGEGDGNGEIEGDCEEEIIGDEKYVRMREKNRRAQQRFRQRQKAKLQAKELETYQLQKQIQDLQARLTAIQLRGSSPDTQMQLARMNAQVQALQLENNELRLLASRLLDENSALKVTQTNPNQAEQGAIKQGRARTEVLSSSSATPTQLSAAPEFPEELLLGSLSRVFLPQRSTVFSSVRGMPWQRASRYLEAGFPVGVSPGGTGTSVLVKVLGKFQGGCSTVLAQFPPGFVHDYILGTDNQYEEGLILAGSLTDTAFNKTFFPGDYAYVLPGTRHGPYRADEVEGALVITFTRGKS